MGLIVTPLSRRANQGPAGQIRAPRDEPEPLRTNQNQSPWKEPGLRRMNQGPAGRSKGPRAEPGAPQDESEPCRTVSDFVLVGRYN